jgi:hypothetical protein
MMKQFDIEVCHIPSGQYFTLTSFFDDDDVDEEYVTNNIANDLSINATEVG